MNMAIINSDCGDLSPVYHLTIKWTKDDLYRIEPLEINFPVFFNQNINFFFQLQDKAFPNVACNKTLFFPNLSESYYRNVTWDFWPLKSWATQQCVQELVRANIKDKT